MADYHFESYGLFLGFLSYPYYVDGKQLSREVVVPFFKEHRDRILKYDNKKLDEALYKPAVYRMFGTQGLVALSLIDDYSFCSRHFNKNHIRTLLDGKVVGDDLLSLKVLLSQG